MNFYNTIFHLIPFYNRTKNSKIKAKSKTGIMVLHVEVFEDTYLDQDLNRSNHLVILSKIFAY